MLLAALLIPISCNQQVETEREEWAIVLHGGAGGSKAMSAEDEASYSIFLNEALEQGKTILVSGGSAPIRRGYRLYLRLSLFKREGSIYDFRWSS